MHVWGGIDNSSPNHSFFPPTLVWVNQIGGHYVVIHIAVAFLGYLVHKPFGPIFTNKELQAYHLFNKWFIVILVTLLNQILLLIQDFLPLSL